MSADTWESSGGSVGDEFTAAMEAATALWENVKTTARNVLDGDLEDVPYGDRPEVLIGAAFAVGFLAALTLKRLGRR
jgi:hypothetical protein